MHTIRGVILDVDGTLVDSNDAHAHAWVEALNEQGIDVPFETVRKMIGMGGDKLLPRASKIEEDSPRGKQISARRKEIFRTKYLPRLRPTRGAHELLRWMHDQGHRLVVASSAKKDELDGLLRVCGGEEIIEHKTSSDDAEESKPDPDIVEVALAKLDMKRYEVVMLGDTPYDVQAAGRAGVAMIALRCGGWEDVDLAGAVATYDDPADLLARYQGSPLGGRS